MDFTPRQITLAIAFPIVIILFIVLGILILRKDRKYWGNRLFCGFFWAVALALSFNISYLFSNNETLIVFLNMATIEMVNLAIITLFLATLVIYKGEEEIMHTKKIYALLIGLIQLIVIHLFVPGVTVFTMPDPSWLPPFGTYEAIFSQTLIVLIFYFSFTFYRELSPEIRKKFKRYLIGLIFLDITLISVTIDNMNVFGDAYTMIGAALNFCVVVGAILIYFGIVRR
jgi:hypothetical protein